MGGSGSRAAATADRAPRQVRPDAVALPSACRTGPLLVPRYVMFIRRAWSRLRKPSTAGTPYATPAAVCDAGAAQQSSSTTTSCTSNAAENSGKTAGGGPPARASSLLGAVLSSAAEERIQWRRAGRDRRRTWGFRKLKTNSDSAVSSPEGVATCLQTPTKITNVAGALAEGAPQSPSSSKPCPSPHPGLGNCELATDPSAAAATGEDDYACLAEDDINWSTGYVKLCCMPDVPNQDCSSFEDLRKGLDDFPDPTVQSQVVVERLQSIEQRLNLRGGRSVFGETTERICYGRKTALVIPDGSAEQGGELMIFDTSGSTTTVLQRSIVVAQQEGSGTQCPGWQASQAGIVDDPASVAAGQQHNVQMTCTTGRVTPEPVETRLYGSPYQTAPAVAGDHCPVGVLIQPQQQHQQQHQHCWGNFNDDSNGGAVRGRAAAQRLQDSVFNSGSFLYALRHSPSANFPRPHLPFGHQQEQQLWFGDRGSLENYAARGDFGTGISLHHHQRRRHVNSSRGRSGSAASSEDDSGVFAARRTTSRRISGTAAAKASFDDGDVVDIFMFSDDDDDLCADEDLCTTGNASSTAPVSSGINSNSHSEINNESQDTGAAAPAAGDRAIEDGSGDYSARIELAVRI